MYSEVVRGHMASTVLEFGAQPSDSLPALIASFAHPIHVDSELLEIDEDPIANHGPEREIDTVALAPDVQSRSVPTSEPAPQVGLTESV